MANAEQLALLKKSVGDWNKRRHNDPRIIPRLGGANLRGADLSLADLSLADLHGANLVGVDLNLADLTQANLSGADLDGARISEAIIGWTVFADVDLGVVEGLDTARHFGPSTIGVDTILRSGGKIPDEFLRGCGVDPLIQKMLTGDGQTKTDAFYAWISRRHNPLQRCFISYATEDKSFVERLQEALNEHGVDYWYAPEHGRPGEELHRQIDLEISLRDRMLLVCSEVSLKKDWVAYEIDRAITQEEKRGSRVIFPIMIDGALLTWNHPRATRIRGVLAADFRKATKGKAFEERLPKLLEALGYSDSVKVDERRVL